MQPPENSFVINAESKIFNMPGAEVAACDDNKGIKENS